MDDMEDGLKFHIVDDDPDVVAMVEQLVRAAGHQLTTSTESHTAIAEREWDIANTRLRLALNPVELPAGLKPIASAVRRWTTLIYTRAVAAHAHVDRERLDYYEMLLTLQLLLRSMEDRRRGTGAGSDGRGANPFLAPGAARPLLRHCRRITGLALPEP